MRIIKLVTALLIFLGMIVVGMCFFPFDHNVNFIEGQEMSYFLYEGNYETANELEITNNDSLRLMVKEWLNQNKGGWQVSSASYIPYLYVRASNFMLNIHPDYVVLNYYDSRINHWIQFTKACDNSKIIDVFKSDRT